MVVDIPRNVDDKDLIYTNPPMNRPLSEPTTMSYDIQRLKLADLCRKVVDLMPVSVSDSSTVDYEGVIALDQRFEGFLQQLPVFLRNDEQSIQQSEPIMARYPQMRLQRQLLSMLANTKRCKMHQPFLIRGSVDARYSYSRTMSLKSARGVLEEKRRTDPLHTNSLPAHRYKLIGYTMYHTFMATIVLVMDLCFNRKSCLNDTDSNSLDNDDEETRVTKAEVMEACRSLHQDQSASGLGAAYLASLMDVLRKYKVKLRSPDPGHVRNNTTIQPSNVTTISHMRPSLRAQPPSYMFANSTACLTQVTSMSVPPTPPLSRRVMDSSNINTNTGIANTDPGSDFDLNLRSCSNSLPLSNQGIAGSTTPVELLDCFADFDDIWNDYVELGPNLDTTHWDNLFSDLGPGMA